MRSLTRGCQDYLIDEDITVVLNEFTRGKIVVRFGQWILLPIYILSNISFDPKSNYGGFLRYSIFRKFKKKCLKSTK